MANYFDSSATLKLKPFKISAGTILKELADKNALEEDFLPDPAGYLATRLHGNLARRISRARLNSANRLLFSLMANEEFVAWLREYQEEAVKNFSDNELSVIDKAQVRYDFAKAIAKFGDADIINAALVGNVPQYTPRDPEDVFDVIGTISGRPDLPVNLTVIQSAELTAIGRGRGDWAADVAVEIETLIYAVAAAAVFVVVVAVVGKSAGKGLYRDIVFSNRDVANLADALTQRGRSLRKEGLLR